MWWHVWLVLVENGNECHKNELQLLAVLSLSSMMMANLQRTSYLRQREL